MDGRPEVTVIDGGLATELEAGGVDLQDDPLWSARILQTNPQAIKTVHARYLSSGADVITTATYQATLAGFVKYLDLKSEEAAQLLQSGVYLAKEAVAEFLSESRNSERRKPLIAGSIGPYGVFLHDGSEYSGNYVDSMTKEELKAWHRPQMQSLITAGVDLIAMETIPSQKEGEALVELLREFPNTKAWLSFSAKDGKCISHGENFDDAVKFPIKSDQLVAVGINCCCPDIISPLLMSANKTRGTKIGWIVYPNSGETWNPNTHWERKPVNNQLAKFALEWKELGAKWIGGCCRTTPADIAELRATLALDLSPD
ncbi:homocysteine S-methyltransferase YbgG isoform X1 [Hemiscyllium ocellatum]|uniref:homocysteine S-methyltransferase YbgG isoform X1 n=1 Tax=Hemiscyllium ocellatum TaxID=170820 RepID=UPI0029675A93|nr:homocysteine S-methyltransferase YbgG isoform X1 [Hemiscyllium ocellatum]